MALALRRRQAPHRNAIENNVERAQAETRLAAQAYLAWPIALYERIAPRDGASNWYKVHLRQALWFGNIAALGAFIAFVWPLAASLLIADVVATLWIYGLALLIDIAYFVLWLVLAMRYSRRAARGELFTIPLVARVTGTWSRKP